MSLARFLAELPVNERVIFSTTHGEGGEQVLWCKVEVDGKPAGCAASFTGTAAGGTAAGWSDELAVGLVDAARHDGVWAEQRKALEEEARRAKTRRVRAKNQHARREQHKQQVLKEHEERLRAQTKEDHNAYSGAEGQTLENTDEG